jgi:hypothetical protein
MTQGKRRQIKPLEVACIGGTTPYIQGVGERRKKTENGRPEGLAKHAGGQPLFGIGEPFQQ